MLLQNMFELEKAKECSGLCPARHAINLQICYGAASTAQGKPDRTCTGRLMIIFVFAGKELTQEKARGFNWLLE